MEKNEKKKKKKNRARPGSSIGRLLRQEKSAHGIGWLFRIELVYCLSYVRLLAERKERSAGRENNTMPRITAKGGFVRTDGQMDLHRMLLGL